MHKYTKILTTHPNTRSAGHIFPESKDLCPLCNWDEACLVGLGCEWMLPILLFHPGRVCCFGPVPCIVSFSSSPSSTWLPFCRFFIPQTSLAFAGCLEHTAMVHSCFFYGSPSCAVLAHSPFFSPIPFWTPSCDSLLWRAAERAGGRNRRGWWEIGQPKVSQAIFAGGLIV